MAASLARLLRLLAAGLALTLLTAACGDDDDSGDEASTEEAGDDGSSTETDDDGEEAEDDGDDGGVPDPCGFLTLDDLQTLFGSPFDEGEATNDVETAGQRQCTWSNTDAPPVKVISISVSTDDSIEEAFGIDAEELFEQTKAAFEDGITEEDLGLGDQSMRTGSSIYVLDDGTFYTFLITGTSDEAIAGLRSMAEQVVG